MSQSFTRIVEASAPEQVSSVLGALLAFVSVGILYAAIAITL